MVNRDTLRSAALAHNVRRWLDELKSSMDLTGGMEPRLVEASGDGRSGAGEGRSGAGERAAALRPASGAGWRAVGAARSPRSAEEGEAVLEGWLLKRKARDAWGVWRCCG